MWRSMMWSHHCVNMCFFSPPFLLLTLEDKLRYFWWTVHDVTTICTQGTPLLIWNGMLAGRNTKLSELWSSYKMQIFSLILRLPQPRRGDADHFQFLNGRRSLNRILRLPNSIFMVMSSRSHIRALHALLMFWDENSGSGRISWFGTIESTEKLTGICINYCLF